MLLHEAINDHSWYERSHSQYTKTEATACAVSKQRALSETWYVPHEVLDCFDTAQAAASVLGVPLMFQRTTMSACKRGTVPLTAYFQPSPHIR
jgi:hypothetical protein